VQTTIIADRRQSIGGLLCALALCGIACSRQAPSAAATAAGAANLGAAARASEGGVVAAANCLPGHDGYLRLRMRGASNLDIDWHDADMHCEGGPRPNQKGLRLTFAGPEPGGAHTLRFVFGIAAAPGVRSAHNVPANVTVIFEGERKLFSTAGDGKCTVDEFSERPLPPNGVPAQQAARLQQLTARGFCVEPAVALGGRAGLLLSRFDFSGPVLEEDAADDPPSIRP
jgi:hypothetical protein